MNIEGLIQVARQINKDREAELASLEAQERVAGHAAFMAYLEAEIPRDAWYTVPGTAFATIEWCETVYWPLLADFAALAAAVWEKYGQSFQPVSRQLQAAKSEAWRSGDVRTFDLIHNAGLGL